MQEVGTLFDDEFSEGAHVVLPLWRLRFEIGKGLPMRP